MILSKLKSNKWIDQDTRAIQIVFTFFNVQNNLYYTFQINFEMPNGSNSFKIYKHMITQPFFMFKQVENASFQSNIEGLTLIFYCFLLVNCFIYSLKILFELQLSISKLTNILELINILSVLIAIICSFVENIYQNMIEIDWSNDMEYHDFTAILELQKANNYCFGIGCFFLPFRIMTYLAHYEFFNPAKTILNTVVRTTPGILAYCVIIIVITMTWAIGVYVFMSNISFEFSTYAKTVLKMAKILDFEAEPRAVGYSSEDHAMYQTGLFIVSMYKIFVLVIGIALVVNLYKKAMIFQQGHCSPDPQKVAFYNQVTEIQEKIEEIHKKTSNAA